MKNTTKRFVIIAFLALIMVSTVFISCGPSVSGTYIWYWEDFPDPDEGTIIFSGKNFVLTGDGETFSGTFKKAGNKLSIYIPEEDDTLVLTIIDKDTLYDEDGGYYWKKKK